MAVRAPAVAVVAVTAFVAGFLASHGCGGSADPARSPPPTVPTVRPEPPTHGETTTSDRRRPRRAIPAPEPAPAERAGVSAAARSADPPSDTDFPSADVEVAWPNGDPAGNAVVYALPPGAKCPEDADPPNVTCDANGRARLHVLAPGRYDVGGLDGTFQVLATDIEFPRSDPLRLVLPEPSEVTVHLPSQGRPEKARERDPQFALRIVLDAEERRQYPGRGEVSQAWAQGWIWSSGQDWLTLVPRGARCRIEHSAWFHAVPEEFAGPADVRISPAPRYPAHVRIELRPPGRRFDRAIRLDVQFRREPSSRWTRERRATLPAGMTVGVVDSLSFDDEFDAVSGTLTWTGAGLIAGSTDFHDLSDTSPTTIDARIDLDPGREPGPDATEAPQPDDEPSDEWSFRVADAGLPGDDPIDARVFQKDGSYCDVSVPRREAGKLQVTGAKWVVASRGSLVSEAVDLPATPVGDVTLDLAQGGFLVVVPANVPPPALGVACIGRSDGRPFLWGEGGAGTGCDLQVGLVLGPMRPGVATFEITLRGRVLATATAEVRAGTYEPLRIPRLRTQ